MVAAMTVSPISRAFLRVGASRTWAATCASTPSRALPGFPAPFQGYRVVFSVRRSFGAKTRELHGTWQGTYRLPCIQRAWAHNMRAPNPTESEADVAADRSAVD